MKFYDKIIKKYYNKIGFGTSPIGGVTLLGNKHVGMGEQNYLKSLSVLEYAYKKGINFFDTADVYGNGRAEKILGKIFSKNDDVVICTKFGNTVVNNKISFSYSANYLVQCVDNSLKRLQRDYIDILLLHSPPNNIKLSLLFEKKILKLLNQKKILSFGISCHSVDSGINFIKKYDFINHIQLNYNLLDRRAEEKLFSLANKKSIIIIARAPYANGMIFKNNLLKNFKKNDFRSRVDLDTKKWINDNIKKVNFLNKKKGGLAVSALRFNISNSCISVTIPGMRSIYQVNSAVNALRFGRFSKSDILKIYKCIPTTYSGWMKNDK